MEKSFLSFVSSYPSWQPSAQGMQFLTTLKTFRNRKLQGTVSGYKHSSPWLLENPYLRQQNARHSNYFRREASYNNLRPGCHLGSQWLVQTDPRPHPYLLDWFYISGPTNYPIILWMSPLLLWILTVSKARTSGHHPSVIRLTSTENGGVIYLRIESAVIQKLLNHPLQSKAFFNITSLARWSPLQKDIGGQVRVHVMGISRASRLWTPHWPKPGKLSRVFRVPSLHWQQSS